MKDEIKQTIIEEENWIWKFSQNYLNNKLSQTPILKWNDILKFLKDDLDTSVLNKAKAKARRFIDQYGFNGWKDAVTEHNLVGILDNYYWETLHDTTGGRKTGNRSAAQLLRKNGPYDTSKKESIKYTIIEEVSKEIESYGNCNLSLDQIKMFLGQDYMINLIADNIVNSEPNVSQ